MLDLFPGQAGTGLLEMYRHVIEADESLVLDDFVYPHELLGGEKRRYDIRVAHVTGDSLAYTFRDVTERHSQREIAQQAGRDRQRLDELETFHRLTLGRELKMIELKKEIEYLKKGHGSAVGTGSDDQTEP